MNHAYRLVWSELSASLVAVPETAAGRGKGCGARVARGLAGAVVAGALAWGVAYHVGLRLKPLRPQRPAKAG